MTASLIPQEAFNKVIDGRQVALINLSNSLGTTVQISNYGARIISFLVKDASGYLRDIVIGPASLEGYINAKERYFNAIIGRYAGRIAKGSFILDGKPQRVTVNNGGNHLHGGPHGLHEQVWEVVKHASNKIKLRCALPDGHEGFSGNLEVTVKYLLTEQNELVIDYLAKSDKDTVINLTNHAFFNLNKTHEGDVLDNKLLISSRKYLVVDANAIPTGEIKDIKNTPFDFTSFKALGQDIKADNEQLKNARGYDVSFLLDDYPSKDGTSFFAAALTSPSTGLRLEVLTTEPSVHLYTGNFLEGADSGKNNTPCAKHSAVCLETQHFPDSPNKTAFPSVELKVGEEFKSCTVYRVSADIV